MDRQALGPAAVAAPIERATANDLMQLATDVGPVPMQVGAVLVLEPGPSLSADAIERTLAERVAGVGRLRQCFVRTPPGCGRPIWVDDPGFVPEQHIAVRRCPAPGDDAALLALATELVDERLPFDRPLWSATVVPGLEHGAIALVVVLHHVVADGIGGLAVLAGLVDGAPAAADDDFPRPRPTATSLAREALRTRLRTLRRWPDAAPAIRATIDAARRGQPEAACCSLNRPTGPRRGSGAVEVDLGALHQAARSRGATVNDLLVVAATSALGDLLARRGEVIDHLVVSMPFSSRPSASTGELGNAVGVLLVDVPVAGDLDERVTEVARRTGELKRTTPPAAVAALVGGAFRAMASLRLLRWFTRRQRRINTIVTNVHGPDAALHFAGARIERMLPMSIVTGNVTVGFAALSYAGTLAITIQADLDACPELEALTGLLRRATDELVDLGVQPACDTTEPGAR